MQDAVIVSTARTPIGKAFRGGLNDTDGATLGAHAIKHAVERAGIEPGEVEDVIMGCALQQGATGGNVARQALVRAGLPVTVSGATIDRQCSSGLQAIAVVQHLDIAGGDQAIAFHDIDRVGHQSRRHLGRHNLRGQSQCGHKCSEKPH